MTRYFEEVVPYAQFTAQASCSGFVLSRLITSDGFASLDLVQQQRGEEAHQRKPGGCGCVDVASAEIIDAALLKALARATLSKVCCVFVASF